MRPLAVACYVLAVLGLALSTQVGWAAAVVACVALAAAVTLSVAEARKDHAHGLLANSATAAQENARQAMEDVKRLRTELHAALDQVRRHGSGRGGL